MNKGKVYLIPCGLGGENEDVILPHETIEATHSLNEFIVEKEKTTRHFLKRINYPHPLNDLILHPLNKHTNPNEVSSYLSACKSGKSIGIISEAGCPAIADPGAIVVAMAHEQNIEVVPLVGPSSILMALMASGMNGQSFVFHGYIPKEKGDRTKFIKRMEGDAKSRKQSQIFMETPFRNNQLLDELLQTCNGITKLCIASNISTTKQKIVTKPIAQWKKHKPSLHKIPVVFVMY